ncbi:MAG TPA: hypothetical protein VGO62_03100 [Myxococcota bacterium]|jgi:hypothetical protein
MLQHTAGIVLAFSLCALGATLAACPASTGEGEGEGEGAAGEGEGAAGEGEGEGAAGEGEGEGEGGGGGDCASLAAFANPAGNQFVLTDASLQADPQNLGQCAAGESAFTVTFTFATVDGSGYEPDFGAASIAVSDNGVASHDGSFGPGGACDQLPVPGGFDECDGIQPCPMTCPLCYVTAPTDLAVQYQALDGNNRSQAQCVVP